MPADSADGGRQAAASFPPPLPSSGSAAALRFACLATAAAADTSGADGTCSQHGHIMNQRGAKQYCLHKVR